MGLFTQLNGVLGRNTWPVPGQAATWAEVEFFAALRTSDRVRLRQEVSIPWNYPYVITPVPRMISRASANMLYGEPPTITAADENDDEVLDFIVSENDLAAELHRGAVMASSEGDVYGRVIVNPAVLDAPIIEFVSRSRVIPHFNGRFLSACTFVTQWATGTNEFVRLFEHYEPGVVRSELFKGTGSSLGFAMQLDAFEPTAGKAEAVMTGIQSPLAVFIPNSIDADPTRGFSDYRGLEDRFLSINETATVGQQNLRLAGKKRALVDGTYIRDGGVPLGDDVFIAQGSKTLGDAKKPLQMLEYEFDSTAVVQWIDHLLDTSLMLAGIAPQSVGRAVEGGAVSGTALRLKMAHSLIESSGKGRFFDRGTRRLLQYAAIIDARRTTEGGFGRRWTDPGLPSIERADALPRDDMEAAQRLVLLTNADAISVREKVIAVHPDWTDAQVEEEVAAIEKAATPAVAPVDQIQTPRPGLILPAEQ